MEKRDFVASASAAVSAALSSSSQAYRMYSAVPAPPPAPRAEKMYIRDVPEREARELLTIWTLPRCPARFRELIVEAVTQVSALPKGGSLPNLMKDGIERLSAYIWYNERDLAAAWTRDAEGSHLSRPIYTFQLAQAAVLRELVRLSRKQALSAFPHTATDSKRAELQTVEVAPFGYVFTPRSLCEAQNCMVCGVLSSEDQGVTQPQYTFPEGRICTDWFIPGKRIFMRRCISCDGFVCVRCAPKSAITADEREEDFNPEKRARTEIRTSPLGGRASKTCSRCGLFICINCSHKPVTYFGRRLESADINPCPFLHPHTLKKSSTPLCGTCAAHNRQKLHQAAGSASLQMPPPPAPHR